MSSVIAFDSYNMAETGEVAKTLNSAATDTDHLPIVCIEGNGSRPSHQGDGYKVSEQMYTLNTTEVHGVCYCLQGSGVTSQNENGCGYMQDLCYTLNDVDRHGVCCINSGGDEIAETIDSNYYKGQGSVYGAEREFVCFFYDHHPQDSRCTYEADTANSVTSRYGTGGATLQ